MTSESQFASRWVRLLVEDPTLSKPDDLSDESWAEAQQLARLQSWLWLPDPPSLERDPVAAMLGLIPDDGSTLNAAKLKRSRMHAGLKVSGVAERLRSYGWHVSAAEVRDWESVPGQTLAPALAQRLADVVGIPVEELLEPAKTSAPSFADADNARWKGIVERFSRLLDVPSVQSERRLVAALALARFRNETPASYLEAADHYVSGLESAHEA